MVSYKSWLLAAFGMLALAACAKFDDEATSEIEADPYTGTYLYIASGTTYAGNAVAMGTPSNTIARYYADGTFDRLVIDYATSPGDTPVSMISYSATHLLVLVENASGRRIDIVAKDGSGSSTFLTNSTAMNAVVRNLVGTSDGGFLVSKSSAIEKFSSAKARVTMGANPYVSAPAAPCATTATLIPRMVVGPSDNIFYVHAAASPNNRIGIISSTGYAAAGNCLASTAGPSATHLPSAMLYHSSGKLFVGFGNNVGPIHQIYEYTVTATSIGGATQVFNNTSVLQGPSAMTEMPDGSVLIANAATAFGNIERYTYDGSTLTRVGNTPYIPASIYTKSVSAILALPAGQ